VNQLFLLQGQKCELVTNGPNANRPIADNNTHKIDHKRDMMLYTPPHCILALLLLVRATLSAEYGVDVSFPVHYPFPENDQGNPLGDRKKLYDEFMGGCRHHYGTKGYRCDEYEHDRLEMSRRQPQSMVVSSFHSFIPFLSFVLDALLNKFCRPWTRTIQQLVS